MRSADEIARRAHVHGAVPLVVVYAVMLFLVGCGSTEEAANAGGGGAQKQGRECCPGGSGLLGPEVNGPANEYAPFIEHGSSTETLWFTSSRHVADKKPTDLPAEVFQSARAVPGAGVCAARGWSVATRMALSGMRGFDERTKGTVAVRGDAVILAVEQGLNPTDINAPAASSYNLFLWRMPRGGGAPQHVDAVNVPSAWTSQPALSPSGDTLVFVSNRPNPLPGRTADTSINIWVAVRDGTGWGVPRILPRLATPGHDISPTIDAEGTLYFASNWDFRTNAPSKNGYDIWCAGSLDSLLAGVDVPLLNLNTFTSVPGCRGDGAFSVNTAANEIFPHFDITPYGRTLYFASDRAGGFGGYDIYGCSLPSACVRIRPEVVCFEGGDVKDQGRSAMTRRLEQQPLRVTINGVMREAMSGEVISVRVGDEVRVERSNVNEHCLTVACTPTTLRVPFSENVIPVMVNCDCNQKPIETAVISDASGIPYFITGYWWPNTRANFRQFQDKYGAGKLRASKFIDRRDYDYACAASHIDTFFVRTIYAKLDRAIEAMDPCAGELSLMVTVVGYTDACGLAQGDYSSDGEVRLGDVVIAEGTNMWSRVLPSATNGAAVQLPEGGQRGNVILSKLRAYFTMKTIDRDMAARSERYRTLRAQNRILYDVDGFGIYDKTRWRNAPPQSNRMLNADCRSSVRVHNLGCNDPEGRRIEIYMTVFRAGDSVAQRTRPLATDMLSPEPPPSETAVPVECDCHRVEHVFRERKDAEFVREMLQRFASSRMQGDAITIEARKSNGGTAWVLRTGCIVDANEAQALARDLRAATTAVGDLLRSYVPSVAMNCTLWGISMGVLRYPVNAAALRDALVQVIGGTFAIEEVRGGNSHAMYRVREGWYRTERDAAARIEEILPKLRSAGLNVYPRVIRALQSDGGSTSRR